MLEDLVYPIVSEKGMNEFHFQQDGAPCHTARTVMASLRSKFPGKLISRFGDVEWPSRSPDLTPPDFFLWGHLNSKVYKSNPQNLNELKANIRREISLISSSVLERVMQCTATIMQRCLEEDGRHLKSIVFKK